MTVKIELNPDAFLEVQNIHNGTFAPLKGFMTGKDYKSVVTNMHLADGTPWTIPVTLDVSEDVAMALKNQSLVELLAGNGRPTGSPLQDQPVAVLNIEDIFRVDYATDVKAVFATDDQKHPGVKKELARSPYRVGGTLTDVKKADRLFPQYDLAPSDTKRIFAESGLKTVVGFQTRNALHRAHEYLQRVGLELADGLFIQPLIGWKKAGDFTPDAVIAAYEVMVRDFYPKGRVILGTLQTPMRYAGPREAVFHAIIRRNYGCTHFIVGRDHAEVGGFYGKYDAQKLCKQFTNLGITILPLAGPYYCGICGGIVTERSCGHQGEEVKDVSGTMIREMLQSQKLPPETYMRAEIAKVLIALEKKNNLFH